MRNLALIFVLAFSGFAWGKPNLGKPELVAPVVVDGRADEEVWIFPRDSKSEFAIEAEPFLEILSRHLSNDLLNALRARVKGEVLSLEDLELVGLAGKFEEAALELRVEIPLRIRRSRSLDLMSSDDGKPLLSNLPSGYLNLRFNQGWMSGETTSGERRPITGRVDLAHSMHGWTFESASDYLEHRDFPWRRLDTRLTRDDELNLRRWTVGDLSVGTRGFQSSPQLGGVSVRREFAIRPDRTAMRLNDTEILIKRDSMVDVLVNGMLFTQLRLPPGKFNLREYPLLAGQNRVVLKIRDDLGQTETFEFDFLYDSSVLERGENEYSYNVGVPWTEAGADRKYDSDPVFGSAYHRYGFTDQLTVGLNFQGWSYRFLLGAEVSLASSLGFFTWDGALSSVLDVVGAAGRLRWRSLDRVGGLDPSWRFGAEVEQRSEAFLPVSTDSLIAPEIETRIDGQISKTFSKAILTAGSTWEKVFFDEDRRIHRAGLAVPLSPRLRTETTYQRIDGATEDNRVVFSLFWSDEPGRLSISAFRDSADESTTLSLNRTNSRSFNDWRGNASVQSNEEGSSIDLGFEGLSQVGSLRLDQHSQRNHSLESRIDTTTVGVDTALVWAGGESAFSDTVSDAFVMIRARNLPKGHALPVNPRGDSAQAELGTLKTVVLRGLSSYHVTPVNLDSTALPPGYLLSKEWFQVKPSYRQGVLINADFDRKIMVRGQLLDAQGVPVSLAAGDVTDVGGRLVDNGVFTNRDGRFLIEGLEPGRYRLATDRVRLRPIEFTVPSESGQEVDLGELKLEEVKE